MNVTEQPNSSSNAREFERWTNPDTGQEFVLIPVGQYEMIKAVLDGITRRAGWDDPALDVYEQFRKQK